MLCCASLVACGRSSGNEADRGAPAVLHLKQWGFQGRTGAARHRGEAREGPAARQMGAGNLIVLPPCLAPHV